MKKRTLFFTASLFGFILISSSSLNAQGINLEWNTFMGSSGDDYGYGIAVGSSGNIYISGGSEGGWGSFGYNGGTDAYVACLDGSGNLLWHTYLGSASYDYSWTIVPGSSGNIYVIGNSEASWGTPVNGHSGGDDAFVACLNSSGTLQWNTFLGSSGDDYGFGISVDNSENINVTGYSDATWGSPLNAHSGNDDAYVARLNSSGALQWNTFMGSSNSDKGWAIALDSSGNIFVAGESYATWGTPVNAYAGGTTDGFVACLNSSGILQWNTFMGSSGWDRCRGIAVSSSGNVYVTGDCNATWGTPVNAYSGGNEGFAACLNSWGSRQWNTFLGSANTDNFHDIKVNDSGSVYVCGSSYATWGSPIHTFNGGSDASLVCLDGSGNRQWSTFLGSSSFEYGYAIALDISGNIYMTGGSSATWGSPVIAHGGNYDGFAVRISQLPFPEISANGSNGPIFITQSDSLQIRVSLNSFGSTANVDYWLAYKGPSGWVHYNNFTKKWESGLGVTHQGPLMDLKNKKVFQSPGMSPGSYTFYFGVDMNMDGKVTKSSLYKDEVQVIVNQ